MCENLTLEQQTAAHPRILEDKVKIVARTRNTRVATRTDEIIFITLQS